MQKIYPCDNEMRCNVSSVYKLLKYLDQLCNDFTAICSDAADAMKFSLPSISHRAHVTIL